MKRVMLWAVESIPSFPSSAWERTAAKLCFASPRGGRGYRPFRRHDAKQSFAAVRSQAELGNEGGARWRWAVGCVLILGVLAASPVIAQRDAKVPDPDPELERKSFEVADGFEVNLFAADPLLAKPIQMNFDAQGRLWVACSESYPQIKPGAKQDDKIIILEDTKGVGKADKTTVFADG